MRTDAKQPLIVPSYPDPGQITFRDQMTRLNIWLSRARRDRTPFAIAEACERLRETERALLELR